MKESLEVDSFKMSQLTGAELVSPPKINAKSDMLNS